MKFSYKNYTHYLTNENPNSFSLSPTDKEDIKLILSFVDISKTTGRSSIPFKALKLLKSDISNQFVNLFNFSFAAGSFSTIIKTAKIIPIHKKKV